MSRWGKQVAVLRGIGRNGRLPGLAMPMSLRWSSFTFVDRHIGPSEADAVAMLKTVGVADLEQLTRQTVPASILSKEPLQLAGAMNASQAGVSDEKQVLAVLKEIAKKNKVNKSYIGMGYTDVVVPPVILRNILENPGWYTQYTPYQPEISQGRLESLLNFQTMVQDMTGLPIANASLLDEGTAAAEAMMLCYSHFNRKKDVFFVDERCHPQTIACVKTRSEGFGINVVVGSYGSLDFDQYKDKLMGVLIQYPDTEGRTVDYEPFVKKAHDNDALVACATDLMALAVLKPPGEFGVDIALGNSQRFGVPLGYGGPHAAFFATKDEHKRKIPGRLIGVSKDAEGKRAYRLSLQTREQHIRREKATSNICTAQALLANMAAMYAVYHGPKGIKDIAERIHETATVFANTVESMGFTIRHTDFFDTVVVDLKKPSSELVSLAEENGINIRKLDSTSVSLTFDEATSKKDMVNLIGVFAELLNKQVPPLQTRLKRSLPDNLSRTSPFLQHSVFNSYHSETEMLRYIFRLQNKDLSLANAMIPLGSCTMKLNATTEMIPVTWPEFANIHPFAPRNQTLGYETMFKQLETDLAAVTGFDAISLQPNSGAQGEYTGLRVIKAYLDSIGQSKRDICLIPVSAHGTNPASAAIAGMQVVVVQCDDNGNLDIADLKAKCEKFKGRVAAIMVTYPSTYGVFEESIKEICDIVHKEGGQVYMDGANLNAQVGICSPGEIGADVCHLNLHKTFTIPHGGGGPGMGPIGVKKHLAPFLPSHPVVECGGKDGIGPVSAAPWGSASILTISWVYLKLMGGAGLRKATQYALLNANYMRHRLAPHYKILYTNQNGMCAHEFIVDCRPFSKIGIEGIDIAKRLHDYGFHSPTMSFPVANTLMVEPTESESKAELDRFCDAMIKIREEIREVEQGLQPKDNNVLVNAPHTISVLLSDKWDRPYSREKAAFPMPIVRDRKFWPTVSRVDDTYGDRNLICSCPPVESYEDSSN